MSFENRDTKPAKVHSKGDIRLEQPMQKKSPQRVAHRAESPDFSSKYTYHYNIQNLNFHAKTAKINFESVILCAKIDKIQRLPLGPFYLFCFSVQKVNLFLANLTFELLTNHFTLDEIHRNFQSPNFFPTFLNCSND